MKVTTLMAAVAMVGLAGAAVAAEPATQPAALTQPQVGGGGKVLVMAFDQMGAGKFDWIGRAVQQNLVTELGRVKVLSPIAPAATPVAMEVKEAIEAGTSAGADTVIFGSFQLVDQDLRINGQIVEVATGKIVGTLKSTGTVRDLFAMEDTVATQAKRVLAPPTFQPADLPLAIPAPPQQQVQTPVAPVQPPTTNTYANDYNRYTYYPSNYGYAGYYGGGYGGWGYGGYAYGGYGYGGYYPGSYNSGWVASNRTVTRPIGIGTNGSLVASPMIMVQSNGLLPR